MNNTILYIENLECGYGPTRVLRDIDLSIKKGELFGIIGPNGSGKTTLLRAITRTLKPKNGEILFEQNDIWHMRLNELARKIAVVSQNPPINFMSVEEYVLLGRIPHFRRFQLIETKEDQKIIEKAMTLTDILKSRGRSMSEISAGERQLALIGRALAQEPTLLLLDEPTTHLDITHQVQILDLVARLNKKFGLTVIMVLHDLNLASEYCHRLVLLNQGRVHKIGQPHEVLTYEIIEEVYKTVVVVEKNPISSKPYVLVVSEGGKGGV